jgi:hypothetical protein
MHIEAPDIFQLFYRQLYVTGDIANTETELEEAIIRRHFKDTAERYRLIKEDAVNILVPYERVAYDDLAQQARQEGLSRAWIAKARPHTVGYFRPREESGLLRSLEPIPLLGGEHRGRGDMSRDWFICRDEEMYDPVMGFIEASQMILLTA